MVPIKLFIDEDVRLGLAEALREAGYDTIAAGEIDRNGLSDEEQMAFVAAEGRAIIPESSLNYHGKS